MLDKVVLFVGWLSVVLLLYFMIDEVLFTGVCTPVPDLFVCVDIWITGSMRYYLSKLVVGKYIWRVTLT